MIDPREAGPAGYDALVAGARRKITMVAVVTGAAVLVGLVTFLVVARPAAHRIEAVSPFAVAGRGATVPFVEHEAERAHTNATVIGPDRTPGTLAAEASGRQAVTLDTTGDYVEFTLTAPANAMTVRLSVPDRPEDATLSVLVDGAEVADLPVTARYTWFYGAFPFTNNPADGSPHHFYDQARLILGRDLAAGATVRLQKEATDGAAGYTVDLADFEEVPPPLARPAGSLSVTDYGADPTGARESGPAFARAIAAGRGQSRPVWIPPGRYTVTGPLVVDRVTLGGAGMWHTVLHGAGIGLYSATGSSRDVHLADLTLLGEVTERVDTAPANGIDGAFGGGSTVANLWIQHTKVGLWLDGPFDGITVTGNRIFGTTADGLNLHRGVSHAVVRDNVVRDTGDDGLALWSEGDADHDNTVSHNTVVVPTLSDGIAVYGGRSNEISDNVVADIVAEGAGIELGSRIEGTVPLAGTTTVARNTVLRGGSAFPELVPQVGAVWLAAREAPVTGVVLRDNELVDSTFAGLLLYGDRVPGLTVDGLTVFGAGTFGIQIQATGSATVSRVRIARTGTADLFLCPDRAPFAITGEIPGSVYCGLLPSR